ncbi:MAG TPA: tetratricopeptide repeat protein, partial [Bryobacteraceae bacterium]|nr:tetratricopeptide repeat protein [Bryobacteraceae bacterium]
DAHRNSPDPELMARRLRQLGIVFHRLGRAEESTARLREAAALYEKTLGETHADTGRALAELGAAYRAQEKYAESEECFRRALHIHGQRFGRQSREALRDLSELARTLSEAGDLKGAIAEYERTLTLQENMIGGRFEELAEMQLTLAGLCADVANYGRARELLTHAVGGLKSTGGSRLAIAHEALAHVQESLGHLALALTELERAAPVWESCGRMKELRANAEHRAAIVARMPREEETAAPPAPTEEKESVPR